MAETTAPNTAETSEEVDGDPFSRMDPEMARAPSNAVRSARTRR